MRVDGGARLGRGTVQARWFRRGIPANIAGVDIVRRVIVRGKSTIGLCLCWRPSSSTGLPYDVQPNLRYCDYRRGEQRQENSLFEIRASVRKSCNSRRRGHDTTTYPFVPPTRALCGPPHCRTGTNHAEDGIEDCHDRASVADIARRALRASSRPRRLRKLLVGRRTSPREQGDHAVCERIERRISRLECPRTVLCPHPSRQGRKEGVRDGRCCRRTRRFRQQRGELCGERCGDYVRERPQSLDEVRLQRDVQAVRLGWTTH